MAKKINIYKGTIKTLYAKDFHLNKDKTLVTEIDSHLVTDEGQFYEHLGRFINIEYGVFLPDLEEASDYLNTSVSNDKKTLESILIDENISDEEKEFAKYVLANKSSCTYADYSSIEPSHQVTREEFRELKRRGRR